jgi:leucyl aminopeptidase (aminopeptidase T)
MKHFEIIHTIGKLVRDVAQIKRGEKVLVLTDSGRLNLGEAFALASREAGAETVIMIMPVTEEHGNEPPAVVAAAMKAADVLLVATTHAITHTEARRKASAAGTRIHLTRGVTEEMLVKGAVTADFKALKETTARVAAALAGADEVRVQSPAGTDVTFNLTGRKVFTLDGSFRPEVGFAGFISGEAPTSPLEGTTNGTIVFDHSMDGIGRLKQPLVLTVKEGRVVSLAGASEEVSAIERYFARDERNRNIAEFAIGTNPNARLIGIMAEDKKRAGTVHFAIGDSKSLGGAVEAEIHLDGLMLKPTVTVNRKTVLVDNGKIMV